jgi:hypothetical protein
MSFILEDYTNVHTQYAQFLELKYSIFMEFCPNLLQEQKGLGIHVSCVKHNIPTDVVCSGLNDSSLQFYLCCCCVLGSGGIDTLTNISRILMTGNKHF